MPYWVQITDLRIAATLYGSMHTEWLMLSIMMMIAPYLVAYAAGLGMLLRNRLCEMTDVMGEPQQFPILRTLIGVVSLTPMSLFFLIAFDYCYSLLNVVVGP